MARSLDDYAYRRFQDLPETTEAAIQKQVLFRMRVNEIEEHKEAYEHVIEKMRHADRADEIVRALLLYKDYMDAIKDLPDTKALRDWTMSDILQAAIEGEADDDGTN